MAGCPPPLTPPCLGRHSPSCCHCLFFFLHPTPPFVLFSLLIFFHLQVLCGQALKLRPGCPRRPLAVSQGFSASALHTLRASKAIFTTHIPTKASCDLTLPHRITPPSFRPPFKANYSSLWSFSESTFLFLFLFFSFLAAASAVVAEHLHVSRLELHHVQRVFKHPFGYSHHHSSLRVDSTGEGCLVSGEQLKPSWILCSCVQVARYFFYFTVFYLFKGDSTY